MTKYLILIQVCISIKGLQCDKRLNSGDLKIKAILFFKLVFIPNLVDYCNKCDFISETNNGDDNLSNYYGCPVKH